LFLVRNILIYNFLKILKIKYFKYKKILNSFSTNNSVVPGGNFTKLTDYIFAMVLYVLTKFG